MGADRRRDREVRSSVCELSSSQDCGEVCVPCSQTTQGGALRSGTAATRRRRHSCLPRLREYQVHRRFSVSLQDQRHASSRVPDVSARDLPRLVPRVAVARWPTSSRLWQPTSGRLHRASPPVPRCTSRVSTAAKPIRSCWTSITCATRSSMCLRSFGAHECGERSLSSSRNARSAAAIAIVVAQPKPEVRIAFVASQVELE